MKKFFPLFLLLFASGIVTAQVRVGVIGGANRSTILETNNLANWSSIKKNYKPIIGFHGGLMADIPLNKKKSLVFQPSVIYFNKGRKYSEKFNPALSTLKDSTVSQLLNYIDIPLNVIAKIRLFKNVKFIIGAGPYASFFLSGREKRSTTDLAGNVVSTTNADLPVGNGPGKYKTIDYGINVLAGFEIGRVFLRVDGSQSLADMYQASSYKGSFKHQVISASLGVTLDIKSHTPEKKKLPDTTAAKPKEIKDKDKDGVADKDDDCPDVAGSKATKGCPDKDGDGVADKDDKCPDVKGLIANKGCPAAAVVAVDTDKDGVPDSEDKCPTVKGSVANNGCPAGDRDGDGINDDVDQCPDVKGLLRYNGCPIPDTDGDGLNDEIDKCKDVAGDKANHGCPVVTKENKEAPEITKEIVDKVTESANKIQFNKGQTDLLPASVSALDEIVTLMTDNPAMKLRIEGHASIEGDHYVNLALSNTRANNVRNYLVSKGIDRSRLTTVWFGSDKLLSNDPNKQAINRRVELKPY